MGAVIRDDGRVMFIRSSVVVNSGCIHAINSISDEGRQPWPPLSNKLLGRMKKSLREKPSKVEDGFITGSQVTKLLNC